MIAYLIGLGSGLGYLISLLKSVVTDEAFHILLQDAHIQNHSFVEKTKKKSILKIMSTNQEMSLAK